MLFFPCKLEPDIWMRHNRYIYEYITVYIDDLEIAARDPKILMGAIQNRYNLIGSICISPWM